ncbi:MAG: glycosyltransferase [Candidatus Acidiferrales bacterium]
MDTFDSLVILSPFAWDGLWLNPHYMARYFSAKLPVLYVNPVPPWYPRDNNFSVAGILSAYGPWPMRKVGPRLFIYTPKRLPLSRLTAIGNWNTELFVRGISARMKELQFKKPLLCVSFFEGCLEKLNRLPGFSVLYYCLDRFSQQEEKELTVRADIVVVVNNPLAEEKRQLNPRTYSVPTGVDVCRYADTSAYLEPHELARIPRPRVGVTATFTHHVDYELLLHVARKRSDVSFVLVGPIFRGSNGPDAIDLPLIRELRSCNNVYWLGSKPTNDLPSYVRAFDAALIPFKDRPFNRARGPLKLYQYLAAGVPVVSTTLSTFETKPPGVSFAETKDNFVAAIEHVLRTPPDDALKARIAEFVRGSDWSERFMVMEEALRDACEGVPVSSNSSK